jgi:hypothetical protein
LLLRVSECHRQIVAPERGAVVTGRLLCKAHVALCSRVSASQPAAALSGCLRPRTSPSKI